MGTDWRDNDRTIEPVVEIYQGARNSYETLGGPRVHSLESTTDAPGGFQAAGLVWKAWAKGYRLGVITSSDHGSTHISYALVYVTKLDRTSTLDGIRKRRTYGATDNLIVEFRCNGRFMGEEFTTTERPVLELSVRGTAPIARVDLIRDDKYVFATEADGRPGPGSAMQTRFDDSSATPGVHLYYARVTQADGEIAWTSPIWVNYLPK